MIIEAGDAGHERAPVLRACRPVAGRDPEDEDAAAVGAADPARPYIEIPEPEAFPRLCATTPADHRAHGIDPKRSVC